MAPFLVRHPALLHNWMVARETALARVRAQSRAAPVAVVGFNAALAEAQENAALWQSSHPIQIAKLGDLRRDLNAIAAQMQNGFDPNSDQPWDALWQWGAAQLSAEGQEACWP